MMPLGLAVVPDVYSRYSRSSASMCSGGQSAAAPSIRSWYQWSTLSFHDTSWPVRRTTTTFSMVVVASTDASAVSFRPNGSPRR